MYQLLMKHYYIGTIITAIAASAIPMRLEFTALIPVAERVWMNTKKLTRLFE